LLQSVAYAIITTQLQPFHQFLSVEITPLAHHPPQPPQVLAVQAVQFELDHQAHHHQLHQAQPVTHHQPQPQPA